jgi:hypothetical protein
VQEEIVKEAGDVVEAAIEKAPRKYVGCFLIGIALSIIILAVGYVLVNAFKNYEMKAKTSSGNEVNIKIGNE